MQVRASMMITTGRPKGSYGTSPLGGGMMLHACLITSNCGLLTVTIQLHCDYTGSDREMVKTIIGSMTSPLCHPLDRNLHFL
jgi:hypothetical protein